MTGIVFGPNSDQGKVSSAVIPALSLYRQAAIVTPDMPSRPMLIATNGKWDPTEANRMSSLVGRGRMPVAWVFSQNDMVGERGKPGIMELFLDPILKYVDKYYKNCFVNGNAGEPENPSPQDVLYETVNKIPRDKPIVYKDRQNLILAMDRLWKNTVDADLQFLVQDKMTLVRAQPKPVPIGYGCFSGGEDWGLRKRPNMYIKVGPRTIVRVQPTELNIAPNEARVQALYMLLVAALMKDWCPIKDKNGSAYGLGDEVAYANLLLASLVGFGDTQTIKHFTSTDIQTQMDHMPGIGFTLANRYMWGNKTPAEDYIKYFAWATVLGMAAARVKAATMEYEVVKYMNQDHLVHDRFVRALTPNIPGFGSFGNLVMLMPRTNFKNSEHEDIPFPCLVDESRFTDSQISEKANDYYELPKLKPVGWKRVMIDRGEIPPNTFDPNSTQQEYVILIPSSDARIVEVSADLRDLIHYKFSQQDLLINSVSEYKRKILWRIGLFSNGESTLTEGYIVAPSMALLEPISVMFRTTSFEETAVEKSDTATTGVQIPKDSAGLTGNLESKGTEEKLSVTPPPEVPRVSEQIRTVQDKNGQAVESTDATEDAKVDKEESKA
jgi:hypothetical protein